jgi:hypothetical protein
VDQWVDPNGFNSERNNKDNSYGANNPYFGPSKNKAKRISPSKGLDFLPLQVQITPDLQKRLLFALGFLGILGKAPGDRIIFFYIRNRHWSKNNAYFCINKCRSPTPPLWLSLYGYAYDFKAFSLKTKNKDPDTPL